MVHFHDLSRRIITSAILIGVVTAFIYFAHNPLVQLGLALLLAGMGAIGVGEYMHFLEKKGQTPPNRLLMALAFFGVLSFYPSSCLSIPLPLLVFALALFILFCIEFRTVNGSINRIASHFFGLCYVAIPLGLMLCVLYPKGGDGRLWFAYLLAVTKGTDIGAYFGGILFGKRPLAPAISPRKTVAGAVWGGVFAIGISCGFSWCALRYGWSSFSLSYPAALLLGLLIGGVGQIGDLAESVLKRDAGVKDSNTIKGLGGVLDLFDSLFFAVVVLFFYMGCR